MCMCSIAGAKHVDVSLSHRDVMHSQSETTKSQCGPHVTYIIIGLHSLTLSGDHY